MLWMRLTCLLAEGAWHSDKCAVVPIRPVSASALPWLSVGFRINGKHDSSPTTMGQSPWEDHLLPLTRTPLWCTRSCFHDGACVSLASEGCTWDCVAGQRWPHTLHGPWLATTGTVVVPVWRLVPSYEIPECVLLPNSTICIQQRWADAVNQSSPPSLRPGC